MTDSIPQSTNGITAGAEIEKRERTQLRLNETYDQKALRYDADRLKTFSLRAYFDRSYRTIREWIGPTTPDMIHVDMPAGTGRFLFYMRDHDCPHHMVGIDISTGMLGVCRSVAAERGDPMTLAIGDAFRLPLIDDSVDVLTSLRLFHLFPPDHWPAMLAEMRRVIKPGGLLITEFRNRLRGTLCKLVGQAFRLRRDEHPHYFLRRQDINQLFDDWSDVRTSGMGLDGVSAVQRISTRMADAIHRLEQRTAMRYVSKVMLVKANKPITP